MWPQYTYIILVIVGLLLSVHMHGTPVKVSFWGRLVGNAIALALLICGGFFNGMLA